MGEENANNDTVDVARLQNVLISVMLVSSYLLFLIELMSGIRMEASLGASNAALFKELPNLGVTFTSLLGVSHATYLVSKAHNGKDLNASPN
jgi:NhaP-type Na+/H+ and K+/H+ antiporter